MVSAGDKANAFRRLIILQKNSSSSSSSSPSSPKTRFLPLILYKNNQKLFISVQTENKKNKIQNVFIYFKLISWVAISRSRFQSKINKIYIEVKL